MNDNRKAFIETLCELAEKDPTIVFIVADVGFSYVEDFARRFPDRFFNFGVTEQSIIMIATGMAKKGLKPYVYSMIPFVLFRPFEMVRNGIVFHEANVKLLGVKGSEAYKFLGRSHNLTSDTEDIDLCKVLNLPAATPQTEEEVRKVILDGYECHSPTYTRL